MIFFAEATLQHVHLIYPRMRYEDQAEVKASSNLRPAQALRESLKRSAWARTLWLYEQPAAMFGVRVVPDGPVVPWALTTDVVDRYPIAFVKASRIAVVSMSDRYPSMLQCVDARYSKALRWCERLGFTLHAPRPFGPNGASFVPVTMQRSSDVHLG